MFLKYIDNVTHFFYPSPWVSGTGFNGFPVPTTQTDFPRFRGMVNSTSFVNQGPSRSLQRLEIEPARNAFA